MKHGPSLYTGTAAGKRVMVVDDNADLADSLVMLLCLDGIEARAAHSAEQAMKLAAGWPPTMALLDLSMPGMNGYALARALRTAAPWPQALHLVALTGWNPSHDSQAWRDAGFEACLGKPVELDELYRLIG